MKSLGSFEYKNGAVNYYSFLNAIYKYRKSHQRIEPDPVIGCIILASPFFFERSEWIAVPIDWKPNVVQGKTYDTNTVVGQKLFQQVNERLNRIRDLKIDLAYEQSNINRYGLPQLIQPRVGQVTFKVLVTEAYHRRCAISGELLTCFRSFTY